jgi:hypothetical protein
MVTVLGENAVALIFTAIVAANPLTGSARATVATSA